MYRTISESQYRAALRCAQVAREAVPARYNRKRIKVMHSTIIDCVATDALCREGVPPTGTRMLFTSLEDTGTGTFPDRCRTVHLDEVTARTAHCAVTSSGRRVSDTRVLAYIVPEGGDE